MERKYRLTRSTDFQRVRQFGKSFAHPFVVLITLSTQQPGLRVGVVAGRALGGAVQRNRAKRLLRAAIQPYLGQLKPGWDVLLIARPPLLQANFQHLQQALVNLLHKANLLDDRNEL